jgi:hypothetical protein
MAIEKIPRPITIIIEEIRMVNNITNPLCGNWFDFIK